MALLFLSSQLGWSANMHLCQGSIDQHSLSLGQEKLSCGMAALPPCHHPAPSPFGKWEKEPCCQDLHFQAETLPFAGHTAHQSAPQKTLIAPIAPQNANILNAPWSPVLQLWQHPPPLPLQRPSPARLQVFLI